MTLQQIQQRINSYRLNCAIEGQGSLEVPKLKQSCYYIFGNEIWGTIYDVVKHPKECISYFNTTLNYVYKENTLLNKKCYIFV